MTKEEYLNSDFVTMLHLNNQVVSLSQKNKKLEKENEQLEQEKCELLGIIQKKDELIKKLICCDNCKHFNKVRCCRNDDKCIWELAE